MVELGLKAHAVFLRWLFRAAWGLGQVNHFTLISLGLGFSLDSEMTGPSDLEGPSLLCHIINSRL